MTFEEILKYYGATVSDGRLYLSCLCDGTLYFLTNMVDVLKSMNCTEIETSEEKITEGIPEGQPWRNYLFRASGLLPRRFDDGKGY